MTRTPDNIQLLYGNTKEQHEQDVAHRMIQKHYRNLAAQAVVLMDKDDTTINMKVGIPTDPRLENVIAKAQNAGIICSYDSDSSFADLEGKLGMKGIPIAERGGLLRLPDNTEIHLVKSGEWFMELLGRYTDRIHKDRDLRNNTAVLELDPWPLLHQDIHLPGTQSQVVFVNRGRKVTAGIITGLLDQSLGGKIVRGTPESISFYQKMANLFKEERDRYILEKSFPDPEGIVDDFNQEDELIIFKSRAASKQRANYYLADTLKLPFYHIGDNPVSDNMIGIPGIETLAVGNGGLKDVPGVKASCYERASGVIDLLENYILPRFQK